MAAVAAIALLFVVGAGCRSGTSEPSSSGEPTSGPGKSSVNTIETKTFKLVAPEGVVNESKRADARGSVLLNYEQPFGRVNLEVFLSELDLDVVSVTRKGEVSQEEVTLLST